MHIHLVHGDHFRWRGNGDPFETLYGPSENLRQRTKWITAALSVVPPLGVRYGAGGLLGGMDDGLHSGWLLTTLYLQHRTR